MSPEETIRPVVVGVIEDSSDLRELLRQVIEVFGEHGLTARFLGPPFNNLTRSEVWEGIDVALVDLMLPGVRGEDILRYLMTDQPHIRRVVLSAIADQRLDTVKPLCHVLLRKSSSPEDIIEALVG